MSTPQLATFKVPAIENEPMVRNPDQNTGQAEIRLRGVMLLAQQSARVWKLRFLRCKKSSLSKYHVLLMASQ